MLRPTHADYSRHWLIKSKANEENLLSSQFQLVCSFSKVSIFNILDEKENTNSVLLE